MATEATPAFKQFGWQMVSPPAGLEVYLIVPASGGAAAEEGDDAYEVSPPEKVLAVAGYMSQGETRALDHPHIHSGPGAAGYLAQVEGVTIPVAAAVLTGSGWYHLGVVAFVSEGEAHAMCAEWNEADAELPQAGEQSH